MTAQYSGGERAALLDHVPDDEEKGLAPASLGGPLADDGLPPLSGIARNLAGTLEGNVLTVNWGSSTPVIYALAADGSLKGLWEAGRGEEIATPLR